MLNFYNKTLNFTLAKISTYTVLGYSCCDMERMPLLLSHLDELLLLVAL